MSLIRKNRVESGITREINKINKINETTHAQAR